MTINCGPIMRKTPIFSTREEIWILIWQMIGLIVWIVIERDSVGFASLYGVQWSHLITLDPN